LPEWKESIIVPIYMYKKGDKADSSNYRIYHFANYVQNVI